MGHPAGTHDKAAYVFGSLSASLTSKFSRTTHRSLEGKLLQSGVKFLIYRWLSSSFNIKIFED